MAPVMGLRHCRAGQQQSCPDTRVEVCFATQEKAQTNLSLAPGCYLGPIVFVLRSRHCVLRKLRKGEYVLVFVNNFLFKVIKQKETRKAS